MFYFCIFWLRRIWLILFWLKLLFQNRRCIVILTREGIALYPNSRLLSQPLQEVYGEKFTLPSWTDAKKTGILEQAQDPFEIGLAYVPEPSTGAPGAHP